MDWYVFDRYPENEPGPKLYGPFPSKDAADEYANELYPDDGSGDTVSVPLTPVSS